MPRARAASESQGESKSELHRAQRYLTRLLRYRPRSCWEAEQRLRERGFSERTIAEALRWAEEAGLLDDERFAQLWVEDRLVRSPRSRWLLRRELLAKGLPEELVDRVLKRIELDEGELLRRLARERLERYEGQPTEERLRKTVAFLRRRGFPLGAIREAIGQLLEDSG